MTQPLLQMSNISKSFAGVPALTNISLDILPGEVHALIGQNGAGKSTIIKVLTGVYKRDGGEITFANQTSTISSPREAQQAGIATIYQELNLVPLRSVTENVIMGYEPRRWGGLIDWPTAHTKTREILSGFGIDIDVTAPLGNYPTAIQQLVAIARAVSLNSKLVIMDEATSSLDEREVEVLFGVIRQLKASGVAVLYISHFLDELYQVCDRVTILRNGQTVGVKTIADSNKLQLIADMLGRDIADIEAQGLTELGVHHEVSDEVIMKASNLSTGPRLKHFDVKVRKGEIVGLGGLLGAGRTEAARALFGADSLKQGSIQFKGEVFTPESPTQAIKAGLGFLTEDRKTEGIIPDMSIRENLTLALLPRISEHGMINRAKERELVEHYIQALGIKCAHMDQKIKELSGGNQQKVLLARWLATEPDLLILDEPTRGVDVGAKQEIQSIIRSFVEKGYSVILISSEFEEMVEGTNSIVVLHEGRSVETLHNPGITEETLVKALAKTQTEEVAS